MPRLSLGRGWKNQQFPRTISFDLPRVSRLAVAEVWLRCCQPHTPWTLLLESAFSRAPNIHTRHTQRL